VVESVTKNGTAACPGDEKRQWDKCMKVQDFSALAAEQAQIGAPKIVTAAPVFSAPEWNHTVTLSRARAQAVARFVIGSRA